MWVMAIWLTVILAATTASADYLWPLPHGRELTSAFGDWRTRHYHAGLDIRTGGAVGLPVIAPEDGYVMRLSTSYYGYGKVLYFKMTDSNVAVFGHLDRFHPEVKHYIEQQQIASESYSQNLFLGATQFRYQRGDTICFSGQTGVGAPHLHFEVRTAENIPLNPLEFEGLKVSDTQAPEFRRLRLIGNWNDELERALGRKLDYTFIKKPSASVYVLNDTLECDGDDFWLSVEVVDRIGSGPWYKPIYSLELRQDDKLLYRLAYDSIRFDSTYLIDVQRNFKLAVHGSSDFYNVVSVEQARDYVGTCEQAEAADIPLTIIARDITGNESRAVVPIAKSKIPLRPDYARLSTMLAKYGETKEGVAAAFLPSQKQLYLLLHDPTKIPKLPPELENVYGYYVGDQPTDSPSTMSRLGNGFWLGIADSVGAKRYNLGAKYYDSIVVVTSRPDGHIVTFRSNYSQATPIGDRSMVQSDDTRFRVIFPAGEQTFSPLDHECFFRIETGKRNRNIEYTIFPNDFPLFRQVTFSYKCDTAVPRGAGLYLGAENALTFLGNGVDSFTNAITAKSYRLGTVSVRIDTIPPTIRKVTPIPSATVSLLRPTIRCQIADNLAGVRDSLEVRIDGKWCIPVYDPEDALLTSTPHFDLVAGKHRLDIKVTDRIGNQHHYSSEFTISAGKTTGGSKKKRG